MSRKSLVFVIVVVVVVAGALAIRWLGGGAALQLMRSMHGH
jgi:hypothetical protein